jgi:hypothetical protein
MIPDLRRWPYVLTQQFLQRRPRRWFRIRRATRQDENCRQYDNDKTAEYAMFYLHGTLLFFIVSEGFNILMDLFLAGVYEISYTWYNIIRKDYPSSIINTNYIIQMFVIMSIIQDDYSIILLGWIGCGWQRGTGSFKQES